MGIRMDQHMGLNQWAAKFVAGTRVFLYTEKVERVHPDRRVEKFRPRRVYGSSVRKEESGSSFSGMFGDTYPLHTYTFPDGRVYAESVQAEPWSSGPCFFLALKDENGAWVPESLWSEEAIANA